MCCRPIWLEHARRIVQHQPCVDSMWMHPFKKWTGPWRIVWQCHARWRDVWIVCFFVVFILNAIFIFCFSWIVETEYFRGRFASWRGFGLNMSCRTWCFFFWKHFCPVAYRIVVGDTRIPSSSQSSSGRKAICWIFFSFWKKRKKRYYYFGLSACIILFLFPAVVD